MHNFKAGVGTWITDNCYFVFFVSMWQSPKFMYWLTPAQSGNDASISGGLNSSFTNGCSINPMQRFKHVPSISYGNSWGFALFVKIMETKSKASAIAPGNVSLVLLKHNWGIKSIKSARKRNAWCIFPTSRRKKHPLRLNVLITVTAKPASENVLPWIVNDAIPADRLGEISFMDPLLFDHFVHAILAVPADGIMLAKLLGFDQSILNTKTTSQISHNITTYHQHVFPSIVLLFYFETKNLWSSSMSHWFKSHLVMQPG